jgi:hypothetical protein
MPTCHVPSCLGHADERSAEATCSRCEGQRWVLVSQPGPVPTDYTCIRCRAALAGRSVIDPAPKPRPGDTTSASDPQLSPPNSQPKAENQGDRPVTAPATASGPHASPRAPSAVRCGSPSGGSSTLRSGPASAATRRAVAPSPPPPSTRRPPPMTTPNPILPAASTPYANEWAVGSIPAEEIARSARSAAAPTTT